MRETALLGAFDKDLEIFGLVKPRITRIKLLHRNALFDNRYRSKINKHRGCLCGRDKDTYDLYAYIQQEEIY